MSDKADRTSAECIYAEQFLAYKLLIKQDEKSINTRKKCWSIQVTWQRNVNDLKCWLFTVTISCHLISLSVPWSPQSASLSPLPYRPRVPTEEPPWPWPCRNVEDTTDVPASALSPTGCRSLIGCLFLDPEALAADVDWDRTKPNQKYSYSTSDRFWPWVLNLAAGPYKLGPTTLAYT